MPRPIHVLSVLLTLSASAAAQGDTGFLRGTGRTDMALSYGLDYYDHFWVGDTKVDGDAAGVGEVERDYFNLYAAYGLDEDTDLVLNAAYVQASADGPGGGTGFDDEEDLQDLTLGAKWRAYELGAGKGRFSFFLTPAIKLPMTDYEDNAVTAIGDGQVDLRFRGIVHYQIGVFWASLESGYDRRNGAPEDEVPLNVTLGGNAGPITIMPYYSRVFSHGGIDISDVGGTVGGFPSVEEEFTRYGLALYGRINENFGLTAGYKTTSDGKNTGDVDGYSVGLVFGL